MQEHMKLQLHQHFDIHIDPSRSLHKATNHILYWIGIAKTMPPPPKAQKCRNTGSSCLDKPVLGREGGRHKAMVLVCLPLVAPIGLLPLPIPTLWGPNVFWLCNGAPE